MSAKSSKLFYAYCVYIDIIYVDGLDRQEQTADKTVNKL